MQRQAYNMSVLLPYIDKFVNVYELENFKKIKTDFEFLIEIVEGYS